MKFAWYKMLTLRMNHVHFAKCAFGCKAFLNKLLVISYVTDSSKALQPKFWLCSKKRIISFL